MLLIAEPFDLLNYGEDSEQNDPEKDKVGNWLDR